MYFCNGLARLKISWFIIICAHSPCDFTSESQRVCSGLGVCLPMSVHRDMHQGLQHIRVPTDKDTAEQSELCFVARPAVPLSPRCEQCWRQIPFRLSCLPNDFCFTALLDCVHQDGSLLKCQGTLNCCYPGERPFQSAQALEVAQTPR